MIHHVVLDRFERELGFQVGCLRQQESLRREVADKNGAQMEDGFNIHIMGATGEVAFCKSVGLFKTLPNGFKAYPILSVNAGKAPDFGKNIQVRTRSKQYYELLLRPDDSPNELYVHTVQGSQFWTIKGWIWGWEAKKTEWIRNPMGRGSAYFVPEEALHDISLIPVESYEGVKWP